MALDEVWRLVENYYANHTFNGQGWDTARFKYAPKNNNKNMVDDATPMRAANKMIKFLETNVPVFLICIPTPPYNDSI